METNIRPLHAGNLVASFEHGEDVRLKVLIYLCGEEFCAETLENGQFGSGSSIQDAINDLFENMISIHEDFTLKSKRALTVKPSPKEYWDMFLSITKKKHNSEYSEDHKFQISKPTKHTSANLELVSA